MSDTLRFLLIMDSLLKLEAQNNFSWKCMGILNPFVTLNIKCDIVSEKKI
jgi:hypothetical protein